MTQANDSITVTPGTGATVATHLANTKEYQVIMRAEPNGHLEGTVPTYTLITPATSAGGVNKIHLDLWNGSGSNVIKIHGVWIQSDLDAGSGANKGMLVDLYRTSAVGTGGTTMTYGGIVSSAATINPKDTANASLPAGVSARFQPATATQAHWLDYIYVATDEATAAQASAYNNGYAINSLIRSPVRGEQSLTIRPSEGFSIVQRTNGNSPIFGFMIDFTVE